MPAKTTLKFEARIDELKNLDDLGLLFDARERNRERLELSRVYGCQICRLLRAFEEVRLSARTGSEICEKLWEQTLSVSSYRKNMILMKAWLDLCPPDASSAEFVGVPALRKEDVACLQ